MYCLLVGKKADRIRRALLAVLPPGVPVSVETEAGPVVELRIGTEVVSAVWAGEGWLGEVNEVVDRCPDGLNVVVARRMSPGAIARTAQAGLGWIDETGGAELALPGLILSRTRTTQPRAKPEPRWTTSVVGVAEAILSGVRPTVSSVRAHTGLSTGAVTSALAALTELGHLRALAARGRNSGRSVVDDGKLLEAYARAAITQRSRPWIRVGLVGDLLGELGELGSQWTSAGISWSLTGMAGAALMAPYLTQVTNADVFVDVSTVAELHALARQSGLQVLDAGRVTLRPFPSAVSQRLSTVIHELPVAPWPRVFADLRSAGVRGEEAAEHLRELMTQ